MRCCFSSCWLSFAFTCSGTYFCLIPTNLLCRSFCESVFLRWNTLICLSMYSSSTCLNNPTLLLCFRLIMWSENGSFSREYICEVGGSESLRERETEEATRGASLRASNFFSYLRRSYFSLVSFWSGFGLGWGWWGCYSSGIEGGWFAAVLWGISHSMM